MASPFTRSQAPGGTRQPPPDLHSYHNRLVSITSNTSSNSSGQPTVFSEPSRSRSNTPSSAVSSGDEKDARKTTVTNPRRTSSDQPPFRARSSSNSSISPGLSPRPLQAQAINSGHRPSQQLEAIPEGDGLELPELSLSRHRPSPLDASDTPEHGQRIYSEEPDATTFIPLSAAHRAQTNDSLTAPSRTDSGWSHPREWRPLSWPNRSVYFVQSNMTPRAIYGVLTLILTFFAAASAAYFAYRTYVVQLWQSEHDYFDWCRQAMQDYPTHECKELLRTKLPPPPYQYSHASERTNLNPRNLRGPPERVPVPLWTARSVLVIFLISASMFALQIVTLPLTYSLWQRLRKYQPLLRVNRRLPWYMRQQNTDPFAVASVRIEPLIRRMQEQPSVHPEHSVSKSARYKRIMPVLENIREKAIQEGQEQENESVYEKPIWKSGNVGDLMPDDRSSTLGNPVIDSDDESEKQAMPTQVGDALKGATDQDTILPLMQRNNSNVVGNFRRKLKIKRPRLFSMVRRTDSWDDIEPPLTALGDDDGEEEPSEGSPVQSRRKNVMISGHVAIGLAQAGAALASTAGGAIGKNILVQLVEKESERIHSMLHSGLSRVRTHEEMDYDQERDDFIHGRLPSQQLRRRTRTRSSAFE